MRVAFLTTDNREQQKRYELAEPFFGPAPAAILDGIARFGDQLDIHVVSCSRRKMNAPERLPEGVTFHQPVVPHLGWGRTGFAGCALAVRRVLKRIQPDIVHGQGTERDCAVSAVHSGLPNVLTIHGNMQQIFRMRLLGANSYYRMAAFLETHALRRTRGVFCNSVHTQSLVEQRTKRTWLVPNPLRPKFLEKPVQNRPANKVPIFLVVGVATRLKRPLEILQVMKNLFDSGHRFLLRFAGAHSPKNPYGARFQALLDEAGRCGYAEHLGVLSESELIETMDQADALIHFPEEEAFGLVVAEALARNLRVFAADVGGVPDIIEGTAGGAVFASLDELKEGIGKWIAEGFSPATGDPEIMRRRYHPEVVGAMHLQAYREALG